MYTWGYDSDSDQEEDDFLPYVPLHSTIPEEGSFFDLTKKKDLQKIVEKTNLSLEDVSELARNYLITGNKTTKKLFQASRGIPYRDVASFLRVINAPVHLPETDEYRNRTQWMSRAGGPPGTFVADILDMGWSSGGVNKRFRYILTIQNINSRKLYVAPLTERKASTVLKGVEKIYGDIQKEEGALKDVKKFITDGEFKKFFKTAIELLVGAGVEVKVTEAHAHEPLNRLNSLHSHLRKIFLRERLATDDANWFKKLEAIVDTYNSSKHNGLSEYKLRPYYNSKRKRGSFHSKYRAGLKVKERDLFHRGYDVPIARRDIKRYHRMAPNDVTAREVVKIYQKDQAKSAEIKRKVDAWVLKHGIKTYEEAGNNATRVRIRNSRTKVGASFKKSRFPDWSSEIFILLKRVGSNTFQINASYASGIPKVWPMYLLRTVSPETAQPFYSAKTLKPARNAFYQHREAKNLGIDPFTSFKALSDNDRKRQQQEDEGKKNLLRRSSRNLGSRAGKLGSVSIRRGRSEGGPKKKKKTSKKKTQSTQEILNTIFPPRKIDGLDPGGLAQLLDDYTWSGVNKNLE